MGVNVMDNVLPIMKIPLPLIDCKKSTLVILVTKFKVMVSVRAREGVLSGDIWRIHGTWTITQSLRHNEGTHNVCGQ